MKIDLFKLNNYNKLDVKESIVFPEEYYKNTDIRGIKDLEVEGEFTINYADELTCSLDVKGIFILGCAITLEDVLYPFSTKIEEIMGKFDNFYNKNKNSLDILPFIWENIVSEVPIKVVKEGIKEIKTSGDGWELVSEDD